MVVWYVWSPGESSVRVKVNRKYNSLLSVCPRPSATLCDGKLHAVEDDL